MEKRFELLDEHNLGLTWDFRVSPFSCENPEYFEQYLRSFARIDWRKGIATTHLLVEEDDVGEKRILGFISLRASSYTKELEDSVMGDPAVEIFELAVADGEEQSGIGTALVKYAIGLAADLRGYIGVKYVLVLATETAAPFYEKIGFARVGSIGQVPRDYTNKNCVPMYALLPEES